MMQFPPIEPVFPIPVIAGVAVACALLAIARAVWGRPMRPAWLQAPALLLRLAALALLAALLLNPSLPTETPAPVHRSLLLIDKSESMSLGVPGQPTRWQEAVKWTQDVLHDADAAGLPKPVVVPFDAIARPPESNLASLKPDGSETNLAGALSQTLSTSGTEPFDDVFVVTDGGAHDRAALPAALALARAQGVPISTRAVGTDSPPRNAWIDSVQAPRIVRPRSRVSVRASINATGFSPSEKLTLALKDESGAVITQTDFHLPENTGLEGQAPVEQTLFFDSGLRTGKYTLELLPSPGEVSLDDNKVTLTVEVASTKLRVLYIQGTHSKRTVGTDGYAINDMEMMTRAWDASGEIEFECLTPVSERVNRPNLVGVSFANGEMVMDESRSFPSTREDLYRFDVMIIGNVPVGNFSKEQMQWVVDWVTQRGAGFMMSGGFTSFDSGHYDKTSWEKITPVNMVDYGAGYDVSDFNVAIPESVRNHPIWRISPDPDENARILATFPPDAGMNQVRRAKPGALILLTRPDSNNEPVMAAQNYGRGRSIAYLSDTTGGWVKYLMGWGPPGGPPMGPQIELGQGMRFHADQNAAQAPTGPPPPYPSPWYGQLWVNVVKWLGENSIRWRRDKLSGYVTTAQAQPGKNLAVAAEVLAVTDPDELLALDVGVRLNQPGSPRVRLEYDRDRREFTGSLPVPADVEGAEISLIYDATIAGESITDTVQVGLRRVNPEFVDTAPDRTFLAEIAHAAGGQQLDSPEAAVALLRKSFEARARQQKQTWRQPLWTRWPWWAAIFALLCVEWTLRRFGGRPVAIAAAILLFAFIPMPVRAVEPPLPAKTDEIPTLIPQLGDRLVRQRDEAEAKLKALYPAAAAAVKAAANDSPDEEVRLRATNILRAWQQNRWHLDQTLTGHRLTPDEVWAVAVSPDRSHFYTRGQDFLREWNAETLEAGMMLGPVSDSWKNWEAQGPVSTLAISPDGELLAITDDAGKVLLYRSRDGGRAATLENGSSSAIWCAAFSSDGKFLATSSRNGAITVWDLTAGKATLTTCPPSGDSGCAMAISPNGRFIVVCEEDLPGVPDAICVWDMKNRSWCARQQINDRVTSLVFNREGTEFIGASRNPHTIYSWQLDPEGNLSPVRHIGHFLTEVHDAIFSPDEKSIFATSEDASGQLSEWDVVTGEEVWRALPLGVALHKIAMIGDDRVVATGADGKVRIWRRLAGSQKAESAGDNSIPKK